MRYSLLIAALAILLALAGCGGGGAPAGPVDTAAPVLSNVNATDVADSNGGVVTISANAADTDGIGAVTANVTKPDGTSETVTMAASGGAYTGTFNAAPNTSNTTQSYAIVITAADVLGNSASSSQMTVVVPTPWVTTATGLKYRDLYTGTGATATVGQKATVHYVGWLNDGTLFDTSRQPGRSPFSFTVGVGQVIAGWDQGVPGIKVGGVRELKIPPSLGYGNRQTGPIPPNSTLNFEVELLSVGD